MSSKRLDGCRYSRFEELDRPALKELPARPYAFARWIQAGSGASRLLHRSGAGLLLVSFKSITAWTSGSRIPPSRSSIAARLRRNLQITNQRASTLGQAAVGVIWQFFSYDLFEVTRWVI